MTRRPIILITFLANLQFLVVLGLCVAGVGEGGGVLDALQPLASIWDPCEVIRSTHPMALALAAIYTNCLFWGAVAAILIALVRRARNMLLPNKSLERTLRLGSRTVRAVALCARAGAEGQLWPAVQRNR